MPPGRLQLGPFTLTVPIAHGAMGEVWRALHPARELPVAVKVLRNQRQREAQQIRVFRTEVRRMARMQHPHVVMVLDHGEVPAAVEAHSEGRLAAGSPWLAMEYASSGSLAQAPLPSDWGVVSDRLQALLRALAHAHARGILHRDLKPENVLMGSALDLRPGLKLADFGIAFAMDRRVEGDSVFAGTPAYMAPEQIRGDGRWLGPWTDLYALGALAWQQTTGGPVFGATETRRILHAHLNQEPGTLDTRMQVPAGFEAWVRRLLEKDPTRRFAAAPDAIAALEALDLGRRTSGGSGGDTLPMGASSADTWSFDAPALPGAGDLDQEEPTAELPPPPSASPRPRPPEDPFDEGAAPPARLVGAGLGLYGLRPPPLIGRRTPAMRTWRRLREVWTSGGVRCVVLRGPWGVGTSRLARWLQERAVELGLVLALHIDGQGGDGGVSSALTRLLRCAGLEGQELHAHLQRVLHGAGHPDPDGDAGALVDWLRPIAGAPTPDVGARAALLERVLDATRQGRPVLIRVDGDGDIDAALAVVQPLLEAGAPPCLAIVTHPSEPSDALPPRLSRLAALPDTIVEELGPLRDSEMARLVAQLLVLDDGLAASVAARAGGSPLFAVQLIGDWVRRGVLVAGDEGFALPPGHTPALPDGIHSLWQARIGSALGDEGAGALQAAAVGALQGSGVSVDAWRAVVEHEGIPGADDALERAARAGLLRERDGHLHFAHVLLVESLVQEAEAAGRGPTLHAAWAHALRARPGTPLRAERLGTHLLASGDTDAAIAPLLDGADLAHREDRVPRARSLLAEAEAALRDAAVPARDARHGRHALLGLRILLSQGALQEAARAAAALARKAKRHRWTAVQAPALRFRGMALGKSGDLDGAESNLRQALAAARAAGLPGEASAARMHLATLARMRGERAEALSLLDDARDGFLAAEDRLGLAECLTEIAGAQVTLGDVSAGAARAREAAALFAALGQRTGEGLTLNTLGDALRRQGRAREARAAFVESQSLLTRTGSHARVFPALNLALLAIDEGDGGGALAQLGPVLTAAEATGDRVVQAYAYTFRAVALGAGDRWREAEEALDRADGLLAETGLVEPDVARLLTSLATRAPHGPVRAGAAALATEQWEALDQPDQADRARAL